MKRGVQQTCRGRSAGQVCVCCQSTQEAEPGGPVSPVRTRWFCLKLQLQNGHILNPGYELDTRILRVMKRVVTGPAGSSEPCQQYYTRFLSNDDQAGNLLFFFFFSVISPAATEQFRSRPEWRCHIIHAECRTS